MYFCLRDSCKIDKWIEIQGPIATPVSLPYLLSFLRYISLARTSTRLLGTIRRELFLTRGCRTQCFNPDHFMLMHNLQIQTFPPFVIFVLPRIDLRLQ